MWNKTDKSLSKKFQFSDFDHAVDFINQVFGIAKDLDHHPMLVNEFDTVEISLSTHSAGGKVTEKDENFARKVDDLLKENGEKPADLQDAKLFTDGGSRGNPGPSAIGYAICDLEGNVVKKHREYIGKSTNNQAEYKALLAGMDDCLSAGVNQLTVFMDSELIINQMLGRYKVKHQDMKPLYARAKELESKLEDISYKHVPREQNSVADGLVNEALDNHIGAS